MKERKRKPKHYVATLLNDLFCSHYGKPHVDQSDGPTWCVQCYGPHPLRGSVVNKRKKRTKKKQVVQCFYTSPGIKYILYSDKTYKVIETFGQTGDPK